MRLRFLAVPVLALVAVEGAAVIADHRAHFRDRLLAAFDAARFSDSEEDALWEQPERPFDPTFADYTQQLRFRPRGSTNPTGEHLEPEDLAPGKRVFVLGESAAFGVNVGADQAFAAVLDDALKPRGQAVWNAGQIGADPWQVMEAGAHLLKRYSPSTLVIFTGNNPWIFWSPSRQSRWGRGTVGALRAAATSRAVAWAEFELFRFALAHRSPAGGAFVDHYQMKGSDYALEHPLQPTESFGPEDALGVTRLYLDRFDTSLDLLAKHAKERGVKVVFVTMPFNYKLSPAWKQPQFDAFDASHRDEVRKLLAEAGGLYKSGRCADAMPILDRALALDPLPPILHSVRAQCLESLGRPAEAEAAYAQAREHTIGNLGARLSVNEVIRRVAARHGAPLVDAAKIFDDDQHARGHHYNEDLVVDDCHPSVAGHKLIADALAKVLSESVTPR